MFNSKSKTSSTRDELVEKARLEREIRHCDKRVNVAVITIQRAVMNWMGRKKEHDEIRKRIEHALGKASITGLELFLVGQQLLFVYVKARDNGRFVKFCQALLNSMSKDVTKAWYVSVVMKQKLSTEWIVQLKKILVMSCNNLKELKFGLPTTDQLIKVYMELIVLFTDHTLWKFTEKAGKQVEPMLRGITGHIMDHLLENGFYDIMHELLLDSLSLPAPSIPGHYLSAAMAIRQLTLSNFSVKMMMLLIKSILTVPGLILYLQRMSPETLNKLEGVKFVIHVIDNLHSDSTSLTSLDTNAALGVFGNLVHLSTVHVKVVSQEDKALSKLLDILVVLIQQCKLESSIPGKSSCTSWHPFFGWTNSVTDRRVLDMLGKVRLQLQNLWCGKLVQYFFSPVLGLTPAPAPQAPKSKIRFSIFRRNISSSIKLDPAILEQANKVCHLYDTLFESLRDEIRMDVLIGLGCNGALVSKMWHFLWLILGLDVEKIVQAAAASKKSDKTSTTTTTATRGTATSSAAGSTTTTTATRGTATSSAAGSTTTTTATRGTNAGLESDPIFSVLTLCCQTTQFRLIILDDDELFVQQKQFSITELLEISSFLNRLVFRLVMEGLSDVSFFPHCHALLMLLHSRDCRRPFTVPDHWLIKNLKVSSFMTDLKAGKIRAKKLITTVPHVIPLMKRLEVFQNRVMEDKSNLGISTSRTERHASVYINVHRNRILEDGYIQLSSLNPRMLKGTVQVKFINEQGLDEAGIDETGVFKEFLEEVIKSAFDPHLNLFKVNSQGHLYPSPTSYIQENHLSLFEFVGKMLGKALYEGIVVDVPFAPFFLSQMLERHFTACYSCLDELPSMDPDIYKSLCYIKHDEGDVSDLCLNFSCDESFLGKVITHDLIPGGSTIPVTNENRISYVHHMAHFKMYTQIKKQSMAFINGFHSVIDKSFISSFSPLELQHLISGNQTELDVDDLRKHTQYFGGYTDNHKVINWLWDIVKTDFTSEEKASFLKFVTSCSKSPLLGFTHMDPPFSIRCVEVPDEEDLGDSVVSVIRGLFSIRRRGARDRLPTSSTCFNLLKLPNYTRKAVLREKLKYALSANAGFELS